MFEILTSSKGPVLQRVGRELRPGPGGPGEQRRPQRDQQERVHSPARCRVQGHVNVIQLYSDNACN